MRWFPGKRGRRVYLVLLILVVVAVGVDQVWIWAVHGITISRETTRITSPVVGGYPDYLAAMNEEYSEGVTAENNAAPMIFEVVGMEGCPAAWREAVYGRWGLPVPGGPALFQRYGEWVKAGGAASTAPAKGVSGADSDPEDEVIEMGKRAWLAAEDPRLTRWIGETGPALARLELAAGRPRFYLPSISPDGRWSAPGGGQVMHALLPALGKLRGLANAATARAMLRLGSKDVDGFIGDTLMTLRLARLESQQPTLIDQLVSVAIESQAFRAIQIGAASNLLDEGHTTKLLREIEALPPRPTLSRAFDISERYLFLDVICSFHHGTAGTEVGEASSHGSAWAMLWVVPINYDAVMREANSYYDSLASAAELPDFKKRLAAFRSLEALIQAKKDSGSFHLLTHFGDLMLAILGAGFSTADGYNTEALVQRDLAQVALALRVYKLKGGVFPEGLSALPAGVYTADRFAERPMIYRRKGGGYVLYSIGMDLKDDGGKKRVGQSKSYDLVVEAGE